MSKKQLLNESEIRRFMKLANLEPLAKRVVSEMTTPMTSPTAEAEDPMSMTPDAAMDAAPADADMGGEEVEVDIGSEGSPDDKMVFEKAVKALATGLNIDVELQSDDDEMEEEDEEDEEEDDEDESDEGAEAAASDDEDLEEAKEETEEKPKKLTEDELVETVLARVTARLVAEVKKKKMSVKERMKEKKGKKGSQYKKGSQQEKGEDVMEEATEAKGGGPLLSKGGNKHDIYKGHADMAYAKGKEGKGGHQMEDLPAKAEHSVTHGGKNLATLGGNKKKV